MDKDKKALTAHEKMEMDLMAEAELVKLQRQYRIMESDRRAFSEETNIKLAKQKRLIETLKKDKGNILTDLKLATSKFNIRKDEEIKITLNSLLDTHDNYEASIKEQRNHLNEVNKQIKKMENQLGKLRCNDVTDEQFREKIRSGERVVKALENQLNTEIKKFCSILTCNKSLREEIEHLIKERTQFNGEWERLLNNLEQGKKSILDLIEQATIAFDQREEWCSKLRALRIRNQNDLMVHTQEMKELQRQLDHDHKLYDFLGIKSQKRVMRDLEEKVQRKKEVVQEEIAQKIERYQSMLKEIQNCVNEEDVGKLSSLYYKREEENFALFNYVNELNHEIEVLTSELQQLRGEMEKQVQLKEVRDQQQKETLDNLSSDLQASTDEANKAQLELNESQSNLNELLMGIKDLFYLIRCDNTPILQLLGDKATIDDNNVMVYLGVLEKRVIELTSNMYLKEKAIVRYRPIEEEKENENISKLKLTKSTDSPPK